MTTEFSIHTNQKHDSIRLSATIKIGKIEVEDWTWCEENHIPNCTCQWFRIKDKLLLI